jgi:hypothetical protein
MMNPPVKSGDIIRLYSMEDELSVPPGTKGVVKSVEKDPFSNNQDDVIISVRWENGSTLSLLSSMDFWKKVEPQINEQDDNRTPKIDKNVDPYIHFASENRDLSKSFDMKYFENYFRKLRDTGIVNMFGASNFPYMDAEHLERYYGEGREDNEDFQELLEIQDDSRVKFVSGLINYARLKNINLEDDFKINSLAQKLGRKLLEFYMLFY